MISPELAGKPYSVQVQRIRYIHCMEHWELYGEAEAEGLVVLESLNAIVRGESKGKSGKSKALLVPELKGGGADGELAAIILEVVLVLVKCASKRRSKIDADYWRVITLVNESEQIFKYDKLANSSSCLHNTYIYICSCTLNSGRYLGGFLFLCMPELVLNC